MCETTSRRPSEIVNVNRIAEDCTRLQGDHEWIRLQFDFAILSFGQYITGKSYEVDSDMKRVNSLEDLLADKPVKRSLGQFMSGKGFKVKKVGT